MLHTITTITEEIVKLLKDDPVRPEIPVTDRINANSRIYMLKDGDQTKAITCVKFLDVIGTTRGHGFTGVMVRHNFGGLGASHGVKRVHRSGGSIGQSADPSRVFPGTKMAGQYGNERVTVKNLRLVRVDNDSNVLLVRGAIPGPNGGYVVVRRSAKNRS
jgi:50S ribosomal protein uL3